jgi:hypothetical protein
VDTSPSTIRVIRAAAVVVGTVALPTGWSEDDATRQIFKPHPKAQAGKYWSSSRSPGLDRSAAMGGSYLFYRADNGVWLADHVPPASQEISVCVADCQRQTAA